ncbi:hypothetical protein PUV54_07225 [Hyphococcus flavus]|uniref:Uncharacterized protein n=1 Tax=Hyphococcus flavus TaxID=1866326 RepID=A0AAE9ZHM1_9PROT|nr:hypothetical protein [Hyphococcus flavus]WDI32987.1 hypothetical protein PUV54_07225 [Hyphococcus flavus]
MRKVHYYAAITSLMMAFEIEAQAQQQNVQGYNPALVVPSQSSVYNQNSVYLPSPPIVHGQDIVRGASGMSCQTAVASGGAYLDVGLIGSQDVYNRDTAALYGRVVVPLGDRPERPDCTKLYKLEIARLSLELEMLRMGLPANLHGARQTPPQGVAAVQPTDVSAAPLIVNPNSGENTAARSIDNINVVAPPALKPKKETKQPPAQRPPMGPL